MLWLNYCCHLSRSWLYRQQCDCVKSSAEAGQQEQQKHYRLPHHSAAQLSAKRLPRLLNTHQGAAPEMAAARCIEKSLPEK